MGQRLTHPLKKIVKAADGLVQGNFQSRAYVRDNDELGHLAKTLNAIAQKLEKGHREKEDMHQVVAMKVHAIVEPLHQTIEALEKKVKHRTMDMHRATELFEKLHLDLILKEAEFIDLKGQMAVLMKRKSKKITREEV